jgi:hypothetical protein
MAHKDPFTLDLFSNTSLACGLGLGVTAFPTTFKAADSDHAPLSAILHITDGRHAAIDLRLVDPAPRMRRARHSTTSSPMLAGSGASPAITHIEPRTGSAEKLGARRLIFSDLGDFGRVPGASRPIAGSGMTGPPRRAGVEIALCRLPEVQAETAPINDFNAGKVRFIIGSYDTMGTGVNVQLRLKALHHLDVPWLPSQIEQREGRIVRQGNQHDEVDIFAYATLGSLDATMWQNNERKARFIAAALAGDTSVRRLEDLGEGQANQFAMAKAIASGDPRLMQKAGLEAEIARLERLRAAHVDDQRLFVGRSATRSVRSSLRPDASARSSKTSPDRCRHRRRLRDDRERHELRRTQDAPSRASSMRSRISRASRRIIGIGWLRLASASQPTARVSAKPSRLVRNSHSSAPSDERS